VLIVVVSALADLRPRRRSTLCVADTGNSRVARVDATSGVMQIMLAASGTVDGAVREPEGVAVDARAMCSSLTPATTASNASTPTTTPSSPAAATALAWVNSSSPRRSTRPGRQPVDRRFLHNRIQR